MDALDKAAYQNIQTAFSAQTSANQIQDLIDAKLDKRRKVSWQRLGWPHHLGMKGSDVRISSSGFLWHKGQSRVAGLAASWGGSSMLVSCTGKQRASEREAHNPCGTLGSSVQLS